MVLTMKDTIIILLLLALGSCCSAQLKFIGNKVDALKFIAKQRYTNSYHQAEELQEILHNVVLQPLLYSSTTDILASEDDQEYANTTTEKSSGKTTEHTTMKPTTMTNVTMEPTMIIVTEVILEPTMCIRDLASLSIDIVETEHYALMMLDSYGKPPPGILQGNVLWLGLYDQCLKQSREIDDEQDNFSGQYCVASLVNNSNPLTPLLNVGICVPDSCNSAELMNLLSFNNNSSFTVSVVCHKEFDYSGGAIACLTLLAFLCCLIILGTITEAISNYNNVLIVNDGFERLVSENQSVDIDQKKRISMNEPSRDAGGKNTQGFLVKFILCFSLLTNGCKILQTKQGEASLGALNGMRVLSLWWVIMGHSYLFTLYTLSNPAKVVDVLGRFTFQAIGNATFSVDSFFFLSGLLTTYLTLNYMKKNNGKVNWVMFYVHRYLRLTPVYAIVIFIVTTLSPHFSTGPLYSSFFDPNPAPGVESQIRNCQEYWWTNLLYINNLYPSSFAKECIGWSWYLANDMQFFIISPFIIYFLYHSFYVGVAIWSGLLVTSFGSLIGISITHNISVNVLSQTPGQGAIDNDAIYIRPWARISTYLIGMAVGYILYKYKGRVHMPRFIVIMGWMLAAGIAIAVVYGLYGNYHGHPLSKGATVVYLTLSRFSWAVALAWVAFACATGYGGPVNALLSWSFWIPLARINYSAYHLHCIIIFVFYFSLPTTIYYSDFLMVYFFLGHLLLSYAGAFVLSICAEAPFMALEKLLLKRDKSV